VPTPEFGSLERVPIRSGFSDEARDFTPWLAANLDRLSEQLGLALELRELEHSVGKFSLDLLAEDVQGRVVIIENQLENSDHTHLGQLLTYCAGTDARVVIWIAPSFTSEHLAALEWLNQNTHTDVGFYAVEVELLRIGESLMAPNFRPVIRPNEVIKAAGHATAGGEWSWEGYVTELKLPVDRVAIAKAAVERLSELIGERDLAWQIRYRKGYVAFQRKGGFNVIVVDLVWSKPVRLAIKLPESPEALGLVNPFPTIDPYWLPDGREWSWTIPSLEMLLLIRIFLMGCC